MNDNKDKQGVTGRQRKGDLGGEDAWGENERD